MGLVEYGKWEGVNGVWKMGGWVSGVWGMGGMGLVEYGTWEEWG